VRSNTDSLRAVWEAWSRGSVRDILTLLHPDVVWDSTVVDSNFRGHDGVSSWLEALTREWKSLTVTFGSVEDAGPDVVLARGTAVGFDYSGGQRFDRALTWVVEFEDGLIVRWRVFTDDAEAQDYLASREAG
jgi:ketosteroid isomerase-like protein